MGRIGFALVLSGAFGNLIDRVWLGYVVDYVLFHLPNWSFAIFNLADAFITVGAILIVLEEFIGWRREKRQKSRLARHPAPGIALAGGPHRGRLVVERQAAHAARFEPPQRGLVDHLEAVEAGAQHVRDEVDQHLARGADRPS
jgi:hypothetical protein